MSENATTRSGLRGAVELARQLGQQFGENRITAESARIAYYFFLSLFPFLLALFALTGYFGGEATFHWIMGSVVEILPGQASNSVEQAVGEVTRGGSPGALSISLVLLVWSSSNVFTSLADGLNRAYRVKRQHHWWKQRALALALLGVASIALVGSAVTLLAGPEIADFLRLDGLEGFSRWPITFALSVGLMWLIYFWLPNHDQSRSKRRILAGAVVGTILWALATVCFRLFVANFGRFSLIYGFVGGMAVLLVWLYLTAMSILIGGEVAACLERRNAEAAAHRAGKVAQVSASSLS